jgi:uncharacterized protein YjbI with pentapeptide repeats
MKLKLLAIAGLSAIYTVGMVQYISVQKARQQVEQLLQTNACPGCNLKNAKLDNLDLSDANLRNANLEGANLQGTRLENANLQGANLQHANLQHADLGCTTVNFNLRADEQNAKLYLSVDDASRQPTSNNSIFNLNLDGNQAGVTFKFNLRGCANLKGAQLEGATMPDGKVYR